MSGRRLSDDERALWTGITRSIAPLRRRARPLPDTREPAPAQAPGAAVPKPKPRLRPNSKPMPAVAPRREPAPPPLAPLGRRLEHQIARGTRPIDGRLDLHGLTQAQAHSALLGFLRAAQGRGDRIVLIITGKGIRGGGADAERGVLKRQVPLWLRLPEFRSIIVGIEPAGIGHGGEGALYVSLRKPRHE